MNWKIILSKIREAREEIEKIESEINSDSKLDETQLELSLRHAYHHLNFAWNTRNIETKIYKNLSKNEYKKWGQFPKGFDDLNSFGE